MTVFRKISSGSDFEKVAGYSRAVLASGELQVHVSGTTGFDYSTMTISDDLVAQTHQVFKNLQYALVTAESSLDKVIRVRYYLTKAEDFNTLAPIFGEYFKNAKPAATAVVVGLIDPRMKIEIEVTAAQ